MINYIWKRWLPFLVADTKNKDIPDGLTHVPYGIAVGLIVTIASFKLFTGVILFGIIGVAVFFLTLEILQEKRMVDNNKNRPQDWWNIFNYSQNRHQDWMLPTIACILVSAIAYLIII